MLEHSGLTDHYAKEREGEDRLENLDELVNAAESFVMQEGFGRDAEGLPHVDDAPLPPDAEKPAKPCRRWQPS